MFIFRQTKCYMGLTNPDCCSCKTNHIILRVVNVAKDNEGLVVFIFFESCLFSLGFWRIIYVTEKKYLNSDKPTLFVTPAQYLCNYSASHYSNFTIKQMRVLLVHQGYAASISIQSKGFQHRVAARGVASAHQGLAGEIAACYTKDVVERAREAVKSPRLPWENQKSSKVLMFFNAKKCRFTIPGVFQMLETTWNNHILMMFVSTLFGFLALWHVFCQFHPCLLGMMMPQWHVFGGFKAAINQIGILEALGCPQGGTPCLPKFTLNGTHSHSLWQRSKSWAPKKTNQFVKLIFICLQFRYISIPPPFETVLSCEGSMNSWGLWPCFAASARPPNPPWSQAI